MVMGDRIFLSSLHNSSWEAEFEFVIMRNLTNSNIFQVIFDPDTCEEQLTHLAFIHLFMYEVCKYLIAKTIIIAGSTCKLGISIEEDDGKKGIKD